VKRNLVFIMNVNFSTIFRNRESVHINRCDYYGWKKKVLNRLMRRLEVNSS
jgi:hypothetical protein